MKKYLVRIAVLPDILSGSAAGCAGKKKKV